MTTKMPPTVKAIDIPNQSAPYYAPATISKSDHIIHISGQVGTTADGKAPACYESQFHLALLNLRKALFAAGAKITDISKLTLFVVDYDSRNRVHVRHLLKVLAGHRPAVTLVPVLKLAMPGWLVEIEAVAAYNAPLAPHIFQSIAVKDPRETLDVVVVGAGLSGLAAARDVIRAGLSCVVLEARDRVGGKTWSVPMEDGRGVVDVGAAWINDANQSRMYALAKQYGAELIEQNTTGNVMFQDFDGSCKPFAYGELPPLDDDTKKHLAEIRDMVEAHCQKVDVFYPTNSAVDGLTFMAYLEKNGASPVAIATASIWTRAMLGQEPTDISALFFLNYCKSGGGLLQMRSDRKGGGQHLRIRQGTQHFAKGLAQSLPPGVIALSSPVTAIHQTPGGVEIISSGRNIYAKRVIVSVPTPVYKTIDFSPPLPYSKTVFSNSSIYGYYTKVMLVFQNPFWIQRGFCGLAQSFIGPASVVRDTSSPADGKHTLTCFVAGDSGLKWSALTAEEQKSALLKQVADLFNDSNPLDEEFVNLTGYEWSKDEFSGWGCPCAALPPGVLDSTGKALREVVGNIHFVGTETAGEWRGYMEGAVSSGERGAGEAVGALQRASAKL